jgi:hypothetical protein
MTFIYRLIKLNLVNKKYKHMSNNRLNNHIGVNIDIPTTNTTNSTTTNTISNNDISGYFGDHSNSTYTNLTNINNNLMTTYASLNTSGHHLGTDTNNILFVEFLMKLLDIDMDYKKFTSMSKGEQDSFIRQYKITNIIK